MTEAEALYGFPLKSLMRNALEAFLETSAAAPRGVGIQTIGNLHARKWIQRTGVNEDQKPVYLTTSLGKTALEINRFAMRKFGRGTLSKTMALSGEYKGLPERLAFLQALKPE